MSGPPGTPESRPSENRFHSPAIVVIVVAAVLGLLLFFLGMQAPVLYQGDIQPLVISSGSPEYSALTLIAGQKGFFTKYGLNVTIKDYPTGVDAVRDLLSGNSDLAYATEYVGVVFLENSTDLKIIGSTAKSDAISLVARRDHGIISPKDLQGKTIAVPEGTQAEFYLGRYLELNGLSMSDVTIRYYVPEDLEKSIITGESDAAIIWQPHVFFIEQQLKENGSTWPAQGGQLFYWVTYTRDDVIRQKPELLARYFQALSDAGQYLVQNDAGAQAAVRQQLNSSDEYFDIIWEKTLFSLSLDQSMIIVMEDEARWRIKNNYTGAGVIPNYIDSVSTGSLRNASPESVNIIE